ncbi:sensor histidine kinase [Xylocopilactobacillus apicola]|nr:histidine kinase [Xylocopilactobacillus apicola]
MKLKTHFYLEIGLLTAVGIVLMCSQGFDPLMIRVVLISIISLNLSFWLPAGDLLITVFIACLALYDASFICFFPFIVRLTKPHNLFPLMIPLIINVNWLKMLVLLFCLLALYFSYADQELGKIRRKKQELQDDSFEQFATLQQQNLALESKEQTKLQLQLAEERNRIARDIHDNVGHLLSSSIIQLGAIEILNQDPKITEPLSELSSTVNQAMDSIRASVHGIQEKSLTLSQALKPIVADFTFCALTIKGEPFAETSLEQNQIILMTIKEALTNVIKHSGADQVLIKFQELPAFYQVQIKDNGKNLKEIARGMGLTSMQQRAEEIHGQLHLHQNAEGLTITLVLPRKDQNAENSLS